MSIALFVDPTPAEYDEAIEIATFVAEAAVGAGEPLILSCTSSAALEIGLAIIGKESARTVEGGERRPSPITLLPLIRDRDGRFDDRLRPDADPDSEDGGTLADLVDLGVIADREESEIDPFGERNAVEAFVDTLRRKEISTLFGLGSQSPFWEPALSQIREMPQGQLMIVPGFFPPDFQMDDSRIVQIQPAKIPDRPAARADDAALEDEFEPFVIKARRRAASIAVLIERLSQRS